MRDNDIYLKSCLAKLNTPDLTSDDKLAILEQAVRLLVNASLEQSSGAEPHQDEIAKIDADAKSPAK